MKRENKNDIIEKLSINLNEFNHFYLADISGLNAEATSTLRRNCFNKDVKLVVVKNNLFKKALEKTDSKKYESINDILKGPISVFFSDTGNIPGKLIKEFRKKHDKPILKGAYVEETFFIGEEQLDILSNIKSKNELVADIILSLRSPMNNVISSLKSGGNIITGVLKTLSEKK
ncbi:MAG: 50S ribosomal protein L10 [Bacteroidales bacterium]|nr:50S ribosomal protein L10 [Bacteroidales bacterium]